MTLHRVDLHDCPRQPWRNGGGLTRELLAWPQPDAWRLRVSVARIDRSGAFSAFAGITRCFAVLRGEGVELELPRGRVSLGVDDDAVTFEGEAAPRCTLLGGPTEDLNLMAARDAGRPRLARSGVGSLLEATARWRGVFAAAPALLDIDDHTIALAPGTLLWSDDPAGAAWRLRDGTQAWWLSLHE